jgi:hypothetical protein
LSQFATLAAVIAWLCNLLKTKTFISQKSLDTPVFRLIRFAQKVLTDFQAPLELFSLEEEAALLPGGLFVSAQHSLLRDVLFTELQVPMRAMRAIGEDGTTLRLPTYSLL